MVCMDPQGPVRRHAAQGARYAAPGQPPHDHRESQRHGTIHVLGARLPHRGTVWVRAFLRYNRLTLIWLLGWLLARLPIPDKGRVYLILDNGSAHTAQRVSAWLAKRAHERVQLVFLPSRSAWLNLIEPFWRILQDPMRKGSDFQSEAEFRAALHCSRSTIVGAIPSSGDANARLQSSGCAPCAKSDAAEQEPAGCHPTGYA